MVPVDNVQSTIIDGGWLLNQIAWENKFDTFEEIAERFAKYTQGISKFDESRDVYIVFDGYLHHSTKDYEHDRRSGQGYPEFEVTRSKKVTVSGIPEKRL